MATTTSTRTARCRPSRRGRRRPSFAMRPSTHLLQVALTPILRRVRAGPGGDADAPPAGQTVGMPARLLDFWRRPFSNSQFCLDWAKTTRRSPGGRPVHRALRGPSPSWKRTGSPPLSGWCASARRRYADRRARSARPTPRRRSRVARRSPARWPTRPRSGGCSNTRRQRPAPAEGAMRRRARAPRRTPAATVPARR